ncbi:hypothetical protein GCM10011352_16670 [Marinobacterium zhoushanense]|uniref:Uncharacterized protein n=1 Tax=Marinobacterium zhoushanense TaxID=1679163 RepID=A0ABQ1KDZ1_9GAMM|nr:hypothetical protein [Marinobacterium zhoushanense]GGB91292.1 hypothetical protein GCM10011352_16670 [Marinobacterium zhoushanense]
MRPTIGVGIPLKYVVYLLPLFLIVVGLFLWFGGLGSDAQNSSGTGSVEVLSDSDTARWLRLPPVDEIDELSSAYIAVDEKRRARVLQNLAEFRATYQQLAPFLEIKAVPGEAREKLAQRLGQALGHYGLGRAVKDDADSFPDRRRAALVLRGARDDAEIIKRLLAALSPYLSGDVLVQFNDDQRIDRLQLYLLGDPGFTKEGVAVFSNLVSGTGGMP